MRWLVLVVAIALLGLGATVAIVMALDDGASAPESSASLVAPSPTWPPDCALGPAPDGWESWQAFREYAKSVIEKYGPPPTPEAATPNPALFEGTPPPGYDSMEAFLRAMTAMRDEIDASGAEARANCTGEQVCIETSLGPVSVAPSGQPVRMALGGGCSTPELQTP